MAYTTGKVKGNYVSILFGDGATPEVFTVLCGLASSSLGITYGNAFELEDYDCVDPEAPAQTLREIGAQDWSFTSSGLYNRTQMAAVRGLLGQQQNWQFRVSEPAADAVDAGEWTGPGNITSFEITGNKGEWTQLSLTITGNGLLVWTDAA